ncbi:hypothetical protein BGZ76_003848 [Entomortierella beljakovae]|nr:hypothetical protein BGZ76_003848 [Entomortierella beljakovae]
MSRHSRMPSDVERDSSPSLIPGGLARASPIKPQLAIAAITRESKESREQTQLWDASLNKVFQNMQGDDTARFLSYFKSRLEIEETYCRSLEKLAASSKGGSKNSSSNSNNNNSSGTGNQGYNGNGGGVEPEDIPTTLRMAYDALVDTTGQLRSRRRTFIELLRNLTGALGSMKENHEKQRKGHKETVKPVFQIYAETRLSTVPKYKRAYEQRCREVEQAISNEDNEHLPVLEKLKNMTSSSGAAGRLVKSKRDMEDADSEYKTAVHSLEIYRQKREQYYETSYQAMQNMIKERGTSCASCLMAYVNGERDNMASFKDDIDRLSDVVECIKPLGDMDQICMTFVKDINSHPKTVNYVNYYQKSISESIFGTSLTDYVRKYQHAIPLVIIKCSEAIDRSGLRREGIYRVSGRHAQIMKLRKQFEQNEEAVDLTDPAFSDDCASIAAVLKVYLRELPEPLFPFPLNERIAYSGIPDKNARLMELKGRLKLLPDCNIDTLQYLIQHLRRVSAHVEDNKMTLENLSMIFTPAIFHDFNSAMVTGPQQQGGDSSLSFASTTASSPSATSPGVQVAPWSASLSPELQSGPTQLQNPAQSLGYASDPSSPTATADSYLDAQKSNTLSSISNSTSYATPPSNHAASFNTPASTVSTAASWSNDLVLSDLILNSDTIFNVLPKLPSRNNSMATIDDRTLASTNSAFSNVSIRNDPIGHTMLRQYSTSRKSSNSSLGNGGTPTSPTDSGNQLRPRMDSLGPNSSARTAPPIATSPVVGADPYQYHLPVPHQQQYNYNDPRHISRANTPPSPSMAKGSNQDSTRSRSNVDPQQQPRQQQYSSQQQQYSQQLQHQQQRQQQQQYQE